MTAPNPRSPHLAIVTALPAIPAQRRSNPTTDTQRRLAKGDVQVPWVDLIGLVGLLGLLGLRRPHPEDSYHPSPIE